MMRQRHPAHQNPKSAIRNPQSGFTLIELMIAIFVVIILAAIAIPIAGTLNRNESVNGTAREVRSFIEGARDRAIQAKLPRGVRFLVDANDPTIITSLVYVGPAGNLSEGVITISTDANSRPRVVNLTPATVAATWNRLRVKGLIPDGSVLKLRSSSGSTHTTYTIFAVENPAGSGNYSWFLTKDYVGTPGTALIGTNGDHILELGNSILPNQEPRILESPIQLKRVDATNGTVAVSRVPNSWYSTDPGVPRDILFSPRGNVIGGLAAAGHIHLLITSLADKDAHIRPGGEDLNGNGMLDAGEDANGNGILDSKQDPEVIITITTQTGSVSSHSVYAPGAEKWRNAETGVETE